MEEMEEEVLEDDAMALEEAGPWEEELVEDMDADLQYQLQQSAKEFDAASILGALHPMEIWEICGGEDTNLAPHCEKRGMKVTRISWKEGFDLMKEEDVAKAVRQVKTSPPWKMWCSLTSTLTPGPSMHEWKKEQELRKKKKNRARKQLVGVLKILEQTMKEWGGRCAFYLEWPKEARDCWDLREVSAIRNVLREYGHKVFWTEVDGCVQGLRNVSGHRLKKTWLIMSNDEEFHQRCHKPWPGTGLKRPRR